MDASIKLMSIFLSLVGITVVSAQIYVQTSSDKKKVTPSKTQQESSGNSSSLKRSQPKQHSQNVNLADLQVKKKDMKNYRSIASTRPLPPIPILDPRKAKAFVYGACETPTGRVYHHRDKEYYDCLNNEIPYEGGGPFGAKAIGFGIVFSD